MNIGERIRKCREVLIETLWNVKQLPAYDTMEGHDVLIETLWNVKTSNHRKACFPEPVLIETLWNVKADSHILHSIRSLY